MNYELTDAGLVTSDPVIASMFLGKRVGFLYNDVDSISEYGQFVQLGYDAGPYFQRQHYTWQYDKILIPYPLVREAYQPVEGEGYVHDHDAYETEELSVMPLTGETHRPGRIYHKRILNIVTIRAELRDLVAKCEEAGK